MSIHRSAGSLPWKVIERAPHLQYRVNGIAGYQLKDERRPGEVFLLPTKSALAQKVADLSSTSDFVPVGDLIAKIAKTFGIPRCDACAGRQAKLNRVLRKPWVGDRK